ncbi:hypothetical protein HK097_001644 [Rhizophlyctis rosea]|uniref:Chromo domain-containing protein n=1 Tax=Rhizophlyctis rosea TaxID=64517 RepID=A0AAD5S5B2_9FUNG|nr:hypothetical protein HK097_001644 [Rhizophlyctis rosea]
MNTTMTFATGKSPNQIEEDATTHKVVGDMIQRKAIKRFKQKGFGSADLEVGDHVRRRLQYDSAKIRKPTKEGYWRKDLYVITHIVKNRKHPNATDSYRIKNLETNQQVQGLIARWELQQIPENMEELPQAPIRPGPVNPDDDKEDEWEVETILGRKEIRGTRNRPAHTMYKVKYVGWGNASWQPEENLENARDLIDEYNRTHP